jgi:hypothetical protein
LSQSLFGMFNLVSLGFINLEFAIISYLITDITH